MGLFKKKKKLQFPSEPLEKIEAGEAPDFGKIPTEAALPPLEFEKIEAKPVPQTQEAIEQMPQKTEAATPQIPLLPQVQEKELPALELTPAPEQKPRELGVEPEKIFELPDFDDQGIKAVKEIKTAKEEAEKERAELKPTPSPSEDLKKPEPEKPIKYPEQIKPLGYPEPEKRVIRPQTKYIDIKGYLQVKEDLDRIERLAGNTAGRVEQHTVTSKAKDKKYQTLTANLDTIQDNLILIDDKLFESTQDSEVSI